MAANPPGGQGGGINPFEPEALTSVLQLGLEVGLVTLNPLYLTTPLTRMQGIRVSGPSLYFHGQPANARSSNRAEPAPNPV